MQPDQPFLDKPGRKTWPHERNSPGDLSGAPQRNRMEPYGSCKFERVYQAAVRLRRIALLLIIVGVLVMAALWFGLREPTFQGVSLSIWSDRYYRDGKAEDGEAIRTIGSQAIPYLLKWINYKPPFWKVKIYPHMAFSSALDEIIDRSEYSPKVRAMAASLAFRALGEEAKDAVPALTQMLTNQANSFAANLASHALARLGSSGIPSLKAGLTNASPDVRACAIRWIFLLETSAAPVLPSLIRNLDDTNRPVATAALLSLRKLHTTAALATPALIGCLRHRDPFDRSIAAKALQEYGEQARSAIPALLALVSDPDVNVRIAITNALKIIDPKANPHP